MTDRRNPAARPAPVVVITGGTSGLGRALARELAARGAAVVLSGRSAQKAKEAASALGEARILGVGCDVRRAPEVDALWEAAVARFGRVDHWINNAGIGHPHRRLDDLDPEQVDAVLGTNLTGALTGARRALQGMLTQPGGGRIWLTEGLGSSRLQPAMAGIGVYGASKSAAGYAFRALAKECRGTGVQIGFLRPGIMPTPVVLGGPDTELPAATRRMAGILGDSAEDVARGFAPRILRAGRNGRRLTWLTPARTASHLLTAPFRRRQPF
ncbi:SDR family oxidoreductase [Streptomonospora halophila]|uniref:SDR family oxidoreductase n=1 Tax=Streptomonospora halophila TaxID=427369 RepID=A0ABP9G5Z7_9ACTN